MAPTWPSIMPLGAITWAPAAAWATPIDAYRYRVASLSSSPDGVSGPQCPVVGSQRYEFGSPWGVTEGACRVECRCAAIPHPKVLPGRLGGGVRGSGPAAGPGSTFG